MIHTYMGWLESKPCGENDDAIYLSTLDRPLAEELDFIQGQRVTVRYWLVDKECSKEEADEAFVKRVMGDATAQYESRYSDITGYLWTDEDLIIGGHDLMGELRQSSKGWGGYVNGKFHETQQGKWLILEIEVHDQ